MSHDAQLQRLGTTVPSIGGRYSRHGSSNSHASVSLHDHTSPPAGSRHGRGSHSHRTGTGSSNALYASGQCQGSHGHSSNIHSRSFTRTPTSSSSSGARETPLITNVHSNDGIEDSGRDLKSPLENYAEIHASTSHTGAINTKHGSINASPEGSTRGTNASHRSSPRSKYLPSVVSATPEILPGHHSTSTYNQKNSQEIASRKSNRTTKGRSKDRLDL